MRGGEKEQLKSSVCSRQVYRWHSVPFAFWGVEVRLCQILPLTNLMLNS